MRLCWTSVRKREIFSRYSKACTVVFNNELRKQIANEIDAMKRAYSNMKQEGYDLTSEVLEKMVFQELHPKQAERAKQAT